MMRLGPVLELFALRGSLGGRMGVGSTVEDGVSGLDFASVMRMSVVAKLPSLSETA